jgi:hypothetical protein
MGTRRRDDYLSAVLVGLLCLGSASHLRIEVGPASFAIVEPVIVAVAVVLIVGGLRAARGRGVLLSFPVLLVGFIGLWSALVRPWSLDWRHGLSDVRDWILPLLAFVALMMAVRMRWRASSSGIMAVIALTGGFHENLIVAPDQLRIDLAACVEIPLDESVLAPTILGPPWSGKSARGRVFSRVERGKLDPWCARDQGSRGARGLPLVFKSSSDR